MISNEECSLVCDAVEIDSIFSISFNSKNYYSACICFEHLN